MTLSSRLGQFLAVVGVFTLVIFCATDQARSPAYTFFCAGIFLTLSGALLYLRDRPKPSASTRFRILRRQQKDNKKKEIG